MSMNSWNEIISLTMSVYMPGYKINEQELSDLLLNEISFFPECKYPREPNWENEGILSTLVVVDDVSYITNHYESGAFYEIDNTDFFDGLLGGDDIESIFPLWELIKVVLSEMIQHRKKKESQPFYRDQYLPNKEKFVYQFSLPLLVRVWYDLDSYTQEVDGGIEIIRALDLNRLPDMPPDNEEKA